MFTPLNECDVFNTHGESSANEGKVTIISNYGSIDNSVEDSSESDFQSPHVYDEKEKEKTKNYTKTLRRTHGIGRVIQPDPYV